MLLVANKPLFKGTQTGWINCGDPIPASDSRYVLIPYPANSNTVLFVQSNGDYQTVPLASAGSGQWMQLKGNFLECENGGAIVIPCIPGLA